MYLEKRWGQYATLILLAFVWGSSFILMKVGLKSFTSSQAAAIRIVSASLALMPLSMRHIKKLKRKDLKSLLIAGFIGSFLPAFLFTKAQTRIDSSMAGMLNSLTPMFTLFIGLAFYKIKILRLQIVGLILGLLGAAGLIATGNDLNMSNINSYAFFVVLATMCYGTNMNEIKARLSHLSGIQITSLSFMFLLPVALGYLLTTDLQAAMINEDWGFHLAALMVLGVIGTALAMLLMNSLLRHVPPVFASSVTYIIPVFAISWGVIDGETILPVHIAFMALILFGVYLINTKGKFKIVGHLRMLRKRN
ncbi:putative DMT superfamily transporter inner membrane protein [Salinivirga cyanobacteriivorans]|uniref:Putative DMT superfamily transporter inner membrane protein n=1 Tax=Salinivirga cyanobacteriivorans TaxID=1307839 RepID=A0A0S2HY95_9BACT|nr:DMT family transporter [Salinivirga cyanobacteriivorans]ALO15039.1 putative DMT superfamily transporter inner membrane protein [Salinivirga cyanobacteriivorans]